MKTQVLVTRPITEAMVLANKLEMMEFVPWVAPQLRIVPLDEMIQSLRLLDQKNYQGLILTSANVLHVCVLPEWCYTISWYCVGDKALFYANRNVNSIKCITAHDSQSLEEKMREHLDPTKGKILYLSGKEVSYDLAKHLGYHGFDIDQRAIYEALPTFELPPMVIQKLVHHEMDVVMFFSRKSAEAFLATLRHLGRESVIRHLIALCISERVASCLCYEQWKRVLVAKEKTEVAMLLALTEYYR